MFARDDGILLNQLFWDHDIAIDYASRISTHPEVPEIPSIGDLGLDAETYIQYSAFSDDVSQLRTARGQAVLAALDTQDYLGHLDNWFFFLKNLVREFFGKGLKSKLTNLIEMENQLMLAHEKFMENDLGILMQMMSDSEDLSAFSGKLSVSEKITYTDLVIRSQELQAVKNFSPFLILTFPSEPACMVTVGNHTYSVPEYVYMQQYPGVTSICVPDEFYPPGSLKESVVFWGPRWDEFTKRLGWVGDLGHYLNAASETTEEARMDARLNLERASERFKEGEQLWDLLSNSSVMVALSELPGENSLLASRSSLLEISKINSTYADMVLVMTQAEASNQLGVRYTKYNEVSGTYTYLNSIISQIWSALEEKLNIMEALCVEYGSSCEYGGNLPDRLRKTSEVFLELRINHLLNNEMTDDATQLRADQIESELDELRQLITRIEPFTPPALIAKYLDGFITLKHRLDFEIAKNDEFMGISRLMLEDVRKMYIAIETEFFKTHRDEALEIRAELLSIAESLSRNGIHVDIEDRTLSAFNSDPVGDIIYYFNSRQYLTELKETYAGLLLQFSSNVPSTSLCTPTIPILGEKFLVKCVVLVNNTWDTVLESASSTLSLLHNPDHIDSGNFAGDVAHLSSVSFSGTSVRLNLQDLGSVAIFDVSYYTSYDLAKYSCTTVADGLTAQQTCHFFAMCSDRARVPIPHPFSGRKMMSTSNYTYDGSRILVEIPCNTEFSANFTGPSVEVISKDGQMTIRNLLNSTIEIQFEIPPEDTGADKPVVVGTNLKPFEEVEMALDTRFQLNTSNDASTIKEEVSLAELIGYSSYEEASDALLSGEIYTRYGCIESNIVSTVREVSKLVEPECIVVTGLEAALALREAGDHEAAVKELLRLNSNTGLESFLMKSKPYEARAKYAISEAKKGINPITNRFLGKYIEKAETAYHNKDYITSLYYSQYTLLKSNISLGIDARALLALAILGYGIYSSRKKQEELI